MHRPPPTSLSTTGSSKQNSHPLTPPSPNFPFFPLFPLTPSSPYFPFFPLFPLTPFFSLIPPNSLISPTSLITRSTLYNHSPALLVSRFIFYVFQKQNSRLILGLYTAPQPPSPIPQSRALYISILSPTLDNKPMPKRRLSFQDDGYFHIYNRGVEKRLIFLDRSDYQAFTDIIHYYLNLTLQPPTDALARTGLKYAGIYYQHLTLISYCLMPNHFHLLLKQITPGTIPKFIHRISTTYSMYFNHRYHRVGPLFQNRFQAKPIETESYLLYLSKYIHLNPKDLPRISSHPQLARYKWSSYHLYLHPHSPKKPIDFITDPGPILAYFKKTLKQFTYAHFVDTRPLPDWFLDDHLG